MCINEPLKRRYIFAECSFGCSEEIRWGNLHSVQFSQKRVLIHVLQQQPPSFVKLSSIDLDILVTIIVQQWCFCVNYTSHEYNIRNRVIVRIEDTDRRYTERDRDKEEVGKVNTAAINQSILPINRSNWVRVIQQ